MGGEALPSGRPRPPRARTQSRPRLTVGVRVDAKCEAVARVHCAVRHNLLGVVNDQQQILECVAIAIVVEQGRHKQSVMLQTRVQVVDTLVERRDDVALQPRPMDSLQIAFRQQSAHGAFDVRSREPLRIVATIS